MQESAFHMQDGKEDGNVIVVSQACGHGSLEGNYTLNGKYIGGIDVIPPGGILHVLVGGLDQAVRCDGKAVSAFQNHFPVVPRTRFRKRIGIRLAYGKTDSEEVAVRLFHAGHDFKRLLEHYPGGSLGFRPADVA